MSEEIIEVPQAVDPVIESASATTSRDNANSGPAAYIIFFCALALLAVLTLGLSSCVSAVSKLALSGASHLGHELDEGPEGSFDDFDIDFDYYFNSSVTCA